MKQHLTLGALVLALGLCLGGTPVFADEPMPINDEPEQPVNCIGSPDTNCAEPAIDDSADGEIPEPGDTEVTDCIGVEGAGEEATDCITAVEPTTPTDDTNCDPNEDTDCVEEDLEITEEASEPEQWPMYVSLGALGLAVVVFIILNLFGSKKK